jgi:catechol 2,3-dioxygenase-like lactoylglutathione lyase family enzyme
MLADSRAFSGIGVDDFEEAKRFYGETLGLRTTVEDEENKLMTLHLAGDRDTLVYGSLSFSPAGYTVLNFEVDDIDAAVDELSSRGVRFEQYDNEEIPQDEKGVMRAGGPFIAWFKDPAGNVLSVLQNR